MRRTLTATVFILFCITHIYAESRFTINNSFSDSQSSASGTNAIPDDENIPMLPCSDDVRSRIIEDFSASLTSYDEDISSPSFTDNNDPVAVNSATGQSELILPSDIVTTPVPHPTNLSKRSIFTKNRAVEGINRFTVHGNNSLYSLREDCPNANICFRKPAQTSPSSNGQCCLSCSCDPRCAMIGNCCDKSIMGNDSMCHWPVVQNTETNTRNTIQYFMVDRCLNSRNSTDCKLIESEPWGSLFPVYNSAADLVFYNKHCAECSGVQAYSRWNLNIMWRTPYFTNELFLNALQGKECEISFTPPPQVRAEEHLCSTSLISRCNVTRLWSKYDPWLEEACLRWFSPVPDMKGRLQFSNIYCQRCNGYGDYNYPCTFKSNRKASSGNYFALLIDYDKVTTLTKGRTLLQDDNQQVLDGQCKQDMVKHPLKMECRALLCPSGFIRIDGRCEPISTAWLYEQYFVQLEMTPIMKGTLPVSVLDSLGEEERYKPKIWFDAKGASIDYFILYVETSKNTSFVEKLIVRVGRSKFPINIAKETKALRKSMSRVWEININGKTCQFTVKFYKYAKFLYDGEQRRVDVVKLAANGTIVRENNHERRVYAFSTDIHTLRTTSVLRKTNFCDKVRLLASEWTGGFQEIHLRSSITGDDAEKILGDSEFDIFLDDHGQVVVEICVEDFNPHYKMHTANYGFHIAYTSYVMLLFAFILSTCIW